MEIMKESESFEKIVYIVKDVTPAFINTLRRIILSYVPTLAIEDVDFIKNSSPMYNEMIAHRLGLIPLITDLGTYELPPKDVDPRDYAKYHVSFKLTKKGPCVVEAKDLIFSDPSIKASYPSMPIVTLQENQELELTGIAILGIGKEHSKWSPAHVYYRRLPIISVKNPSSKNKEEIAKRSKAFKIENDKLVVDEKNKYLIFEDDDIFNEFQNSIEIKYKDNAFLFVVERFGQLSHKEIITTALNILEQKYDELSALF